MPKKSIIPKPVTAAVSAGQSSRVIVEEDARKDLSTKLKPIYEQLDKRNYKQVIYVEIFFSPDFSFFHFFNNIIFK